MLKAKFLPGGPETNVFENERMAMQAKRAGLKLYTDGKRFALLSKRPKRGFWVIFGGSIKCA